MTTFRIAVNDRRKVRDEWVEDAVFHTCVAWNSLAENVAACCRKGTRVIVMGAFRQREYTTDNGEKRTVVELQLEDAAPSLRWATAEVEKNARVQR